MQASHIYSQDSLPHEHYVYQHTRGQAATATDNIWMPRSGQTNLARQDMPYVYQVHHKLGGVSTELGSSTDVIVHTG